MAGCRPAVIAGALVALGLTAAACSSDSASAPSTTANHNVVATTTTTLPAKVQALRSRMLVATDLPGGWLLRSVTLVPGVTPGLPATSCIPLLESLAAHGGLNAVFVSSDNKQQVTEQAGTYPDAASAAAAYRTAATGLASCKVVLPTLGKSTATATLTPLSAASVGEQSAAYTLTTTDGTRTATSALLVAQQGAHAVVLQLTPSSGSSSTTTLEQVARAALAKLAR